MIDNVALLLAPYVRDAIEIALFFGAEVAAYRALAAYLNAPLLRPALA